MKFFQKLKLRRQIRRELDPSKRADLIYEYLRIAVKESTGKRPPSFGEYRIISAMIVGNVIGQCTNRKAKLTAFRDIDRLARALVKDVEVKA